MDNSSLSRVLQIGQEEWNAFIRGTSFSTTTLIRLLQLKYRHTKTIRINPRPLVVTEGAQLPRLESISLAHHYEVIVVVQRQQDLPVTSLVVLRQIEPLLLFTVPQSKLCPEIQEEDLVRCITNNRYRKGMDNAYAIFDFLNAVLREYTLPSEFLYSPLTPPILQSAKADEIISQATSTQRVSLTLVSLYREINALLARLEAEPTANSLRRLIEAKKQEFYAWLEYVLGRLANEPASELAQNEATSFLTLSVLDSKDDPIASDAKQSNAIFKELLAYVEFMMGVVAIGDIETINLTQFRHRDEFFDVESVITHIEHLRFYLLSHVDLLNVSAISESFSITQADYDLFREHSFLSYPLISYLLKPNLPRQAILLGPSEASDVLQNRALPDVKESPLILWVLQGTFTQPLLPFLALLVVHQRPNAACRRTIYVSSRERSAMEQMVEQADTLTDRLGLKCFRRQIDSESNTKTRDPFFTTWYTALLIKSLAERISLVDDWTAEVLSILEEASASPSMLVDLASSFSRQLQRSLLATLFTAGTEEQQPLIGTEIAELVRVAGWPPLLANLYQRYIKGVVNHERYLAELATLLRETDLYTPVSLENLIDALREYEPTWTIDKLRTLFKETLRPLRRARDSDAEGGDRRERKIRKCLTYDKETRMAIDDFLEQVITLRRLYAALSKALYIEEYNGLLTYAASALPVRDRNIEGFLNAIYDALFTKEPSLEMLEDVVNEYLVCKEVIKCFYCKLQ